MRTKIIFTPSDFEGSGQMVIRQSVTRKTKDLSYAASVSFKVGYLVNPLCSKHDGNSYSATLVSLTDGLVLIFRDKEEICAYLNDDDIGFRPMTAREISRILGRQGSRFNKSR